MLKLAAIAISVLLGSSLSLAEDRAWSKSSDLGAAGLLTAGLVLPLLRDGDAGKAHAARSLDALILAGLTTEGLKVITNERRPDTNAHDSFPSLHTSLTFAAATVASHYHPREAPLWFAGASFVGYARVAGREHHVMDVIAGAALGYGAGRLSIGSRTGLLLAPTFESGRPGLLLTWSR